MENIKFDIVQRTRVPAIAWTKWKNIWTLYFFTYLKNFGINFSLSLSTDVHNQSNCWRFKLYCVNRWTSTHLDALNSWGIKRELVYHFEYLLQPFSSNVLFPKNKNRKINLLIHPYLVMKICRPSHIQACSNIASLWVA